MAVFVDFYEVLQVSPNADLDTIHRIYRILAQRLHPDNHETGDSNAFRMLTDAYHVLSDPEQRAAFDVQHREERRLTWKIFDQSYSVQGVEAERRKRSGVLDLLYRKRVATPEQPQMAMRDFEELLGVPKEHLEFCIWYLREGQFITRSDNGRMAITLKGVELAEQLADRKMEPLQLAAARVA